MNIYLLQVLQVWLKGLYVDGRGHVTRAVTANLLLGYGQSTEATCWIWSFSFPMKGILSFSGRHRSEPILSHHCHTGSFKIGSRIPVQTGTVVVVHCVLETPQANRAFPVRLQMVEGLYESQPTSLYDDDDDDVQCCSCSQGHEKRFFY